jgi:hypothetical protein
MCEQLYMTNNLYVFTLISDMPNEFVNYQTSTRTFTKYLPIPLSFTPIIQLWRSKTRCEHAKTSDF